MMRLSRFLGDLPAWLHVLVFTVIVTCVSLAFGRQSDATFAVVALFIMTLIPRGWSTGLDMFGAPIGTGLLLKLVDWPRGIEFAILIGVSTLLVLWIVDHGGEARSAERRILESPVD
jgi:hypothetical protein